MNTNSKEVMSAVIKLAANNIETKEATAIVERLAQCHAGYKQTQYEWLNTTKAHSFCVEFSGRLPIVAIHGDLATAIVLVNQRVMAAFKQPEYDLTRPALTTLESSDTFFTDRRTEFAA